MSTSKGTHTESTDEVIKSIGEALRTCDGVTIEDVAQLVGLKVNYLGDSMFEVNHG